MILFIINDQGLFLYVLWFQNLFWPSFPWSTNWSSRTVFLCLFWFPVLVHSYCLWQPLLSVLFNFVTYVIILQLLTIVTEVNVVCSENWTDGECFVKFSNTNRRIRFRVLLWVWRERQAKRRTLRAILIGALKCFEHQKCSNPQSTEYQG
jgi:hypothetical protein